MSAERPTQLDRIESSGSAETPGQLDRIEIKLDSVVARVSKLEAKASIWGAVGGVLTVVLSHMGGCTG